MSIPECRRACDCAPVIAKLKYWRDYDGTGEEYRRTHDLDCVLAGNDLRADTIVSLWLPLRYVMNRFNTPAWQGWRELEYARLRPANKRLKDHADFLNDMMEHLGDFLPGGAELTAKLAVLFALGQRRCNVLRLPRGRREWNTLRGRKYFDYMPHFLYDLFTYSVDEEALLRWLEEEDMGPFFAGESFGRERILDLAGTGSVCRHDPRSMDLDRLLDGYIGVLRRREELLGLRTARERGEIL